MRWRAYTAFDNIISSKMKERYWTNLVTSLRYAQCVLLLGPEAPAKPASATDPLSAAQDVNYTEELTRRLASELEDDNRRVTGSTLAVVAQQYEDREGFGPNTMRALAAQFYTSAAYSPSDVGSVSFFVCGSVFF